jgi:hypothetical protein
VHFREILSGYFLFSRFDWSIFVTQLVAKHMKEIINLKFSKNSGMIVYHSRTVCENLKIFNKTGKDFVLIQ